MTKFCELQDSDKYLKRPYCFKDPYYVLMCMRGGWGLPECPYTIDEIKWDEKGHFLSHKGRGLGECVDFVPDLEGILKALEEDEE